MANVPRLRPFRRPSPPSRGGTADAAVVVSPRKPSRQAYPHSQSMVLRGRSARRRLRVFQREIAMVADAKKRIVLAMQMPHVALIVWQAALLGSIMVVMLEDDDDGVVVVKREDMNVPALPWLGSVLQVRLCTGLPMMQDAMMKAMRNVASAAVAMRRGRRCWEKRMELVRVYAVAMQALLNLGDLQRPACRQSQMQQLLFLPPCP